MALQTIPGRGLVIPEDILTFNPTSFTSAGPIDATGEKLAIMGRFFHKDRTTKDIQRIGFRFGSVTKAGGSGLTVSLQDISTSSGPVMQPDGTQDQTVAIANGNAAFASNTWIRTGALSADRTVAFGELLAVVIEYDGSGRLGADTVSISAHSPNTTFGLPGVALLTASWANSTVMPIVVLECDDGTFGTLDGCQVSSAVNSHGIAVNTASADEYALEFSLPFPCKVDAAFAWLSVNGNFECILYDGTTPMTNATVSEDLNITLASTLRPRWVTFPAEIELAANTTYRLAIRPTDTNGVTVYTFDVNDANHLQAMGFGTSGCLATRVDQGAWSTTTTRRPWFGIRLSALGDYTGGRGQFQLGVV